MSPLKSNFRTLAKNKLKDNKLYHNIEDEKGRKTLYLYNMINFFSGKMISFPKKTLIIT